jgi:hypothetical protein
VKLKVMLNKTLVKSWVKKKKKKKKKKKEKGKKMMNKDPEFS